MGAAALAGILFALLLTLAGNQLINLFLGVDISTTPRLVFALLGVSTLALLVTAPAQAALTARGNWSAIAWSWTGAMLCLGLALVMPGNPVWVAALAAASAGVAAAVLAGRAALSTPRPGER